MTVQQRHIIKKQVLELELPPTSNGFALQREIKDLFQEKVLAELASLFDQLVAEDQVLRIQHLSVDLGAISLYHLEHDFPMACLEAIKREIRLLARVTETASTTVTELVSKERSILDIFQFFLLSGTLPWNVSPEIAQDLPSVVSRALEREGKAAATDLADVLITNKAAILRLIWEFSPNIWHQMLDVLSPIQLTTEVRRLEADLVAVWERIPDLAERPSKLLSNWWLKVFQALARVGFKAGTSKTFFEELIRSWAFSVLTLDGGEAALASIRVKIARKRKRKSSLLKGKDIAAVIDQALQEKLARSKIDIDEEQPAQVVEPIKNEKEKASREVVEEEKPLEIKEEKTAKKEPEKIAKKADEGKARKEPQEGEAPEVETSEQDQVAKKSLEDQKAKEDVESAGDAKTPKGQISEIPDDSPQEPDVQASADQVASADEAAIIKESKSKEEATTDPEDQVMVARTSEETPEDEWVDDETLTTSDHQSLEGLEPASTGGESGQMEPKDTDSDTEDPVQPKTVQEEIQPDKEEDQQQDGPELVSPDVTTDADAADRLQTPETSEAKTTLSERTASEEQPTEDSEFQDELAIKETDTPDQPAHTEVVDPEAEEAREELSTADDLPVKQVREELGEPVEEKPVIEADDRPEQQLKATAIPPADVSTEQEAEKRQREDQAAPLSEDTVEKTVEPSTLSEEPADVVAPLEPGEEPKTDLPISEEVPDDREVEKEEPQEMKSAPTLESDEIVTEEQELETDKKTGKTSKEDPPGKTIATEGTDSAEKAEGQEIAQPPSDSEVSEDLTPEPTGVDPDIDQPTAEMRPEQQEIPVTGKQEAKELLQTEEKAEPEDSSGLKEKTQGAKQITKEEGPGEQLEAQTTDPSEDPSEDPLGEQLEPQTTDPSEDPPGEQLEAQTTDPSEDPPGEQLESRTTDPSEDPPGAQLESQTTDPSEDPPEEQLGPQTIDLSKDIPEEDIPIEPGTALEEGRGDLEGPKEEAPELIESEEDRALSSSETELPEEMEEAEPSEDRPAVEGSEDALGKDAPTEETVEKEPDKSYLENITEETEDTGLENETTIKEEVLDSQETSETLAPEDEAPFTMPAHSGLEKEEEEKVEQAWAAWKEAFEKGELPRDHSSEKRPAKRALPAKDKEGYYINNAGIILLGPFLPRFFENVGLQKDGVFTDKTAQIRATRLLHYLATFEDKSPEYQLVLNKALCGIPIEEPIENGFEISERERTEARFLLEAVIGFWGALKGTSPEGLQVAFLQRKGKLSYEEEPQPCWKLQVERKAIDTLLDLKAPPWSYSVVKLPWMKYLIRVEWG